MPDPVISFRPTPAIAPRRPLVAPRPQPAPAPARQAAPAPAPRHPLGGARAWITHFFKPKQGGPIQVWFTNTYATTNKANEATSKPDPNNPDHQLVNVIDAVPKGGTLDGAFFDISVPDVVDALVRAQQRGVKVRLVTEHDYYVNTSGSVRPPIAKLQAAGIPIIPDDRPGLMHDKFLVVNGGAVWTGSFNITDGGSYHDNNNAMLLQSGELAGLYEQEFQKMFERKNFGTDDEGAPHPVTRTVQIGAADVTPYFSPNTATQGGAKAAILAELAQAKKSIEFLAFSFTDNDIAQALLDKSRAGVKVAGVFENSQAHSQYSAWNKLNPAQGPNLTVALDGNPALMHHKVIVIDDSTLILGSYNFSKNAQADNDENMLVLHNVPDLVARYRAEFDRIQAVAKKAGGIEAEGPLDDDESLASANDR